MSIPAIAQGKLARRNDGTNANQQIPANKILVSWEEFQTILEKALLSVRAKDVEYDAGRNRRALPRLLLPRVVERLAEVLRCDATSLVVVPFEDGIFHTACGEDCQSMVKMSRHQFAPDAQGDSLHTKHKVTHSPFRVRSLRNAKGLVELEPYLVDGGRVAVQTLDGGKMKVFYPYARTTEDLAFLEKTLSRPKKEKPIKVSTESAFLEGLCWQCREPYDSLKKCANCRKARYCSRVCQKKAWAQGHSLNCEERRLYWERAKLRRPHTTKKAVAAKESPCRK
ncbi:hypothetical protein KFL_000340170 [Klebsormidium nitens]|uniref:MYND-type domain-containing protein n=1 Tax=Klebsormidium nitens TaxID=105231 RepID=A0A1Y1HLX5_KLENI|nr:hypothetical protein KFL_000340170 [Klebsormidium nitens]|eukprot:GAQ79614.1 hypothetical protein KFL_000340170 [Klebsormidium nitens]